MERYAISFTIKPGTEEEVAKILESYGRPEWEVDDDTRLLNTSIFMRGNLVVRVIDIEGDFVKVMRHLSEQPAIQEVERQLDPYLEVPRDLSTPDGARQFFASAIMRRVTHRVAGEPVT